MTEKIFKYSLKNTDTQILNIPKGGKILSLQVQKGVACIWVLVDTSQDLEKRYIKIFGTGHRIDNSNQLSYIGTYQAFDGSVVYHVFEELK